MLALIEFLLGVSFGASPNEGIDDSSGGVRRETGTEN
jgi:hypothetical protein